MKMRIGMNSAAKIKSLLAEKAKDRAAQWEPHFISSLPDPESLDEIVLLGSYSYSLPQTRRRLIKSALSLDDETKETPTAIARDYLRLEYGRGPRGTRLQIEVNSEIPPVPNAALPAKFLNGAYIDIQAAYWSIMRVAGWNVDYFPGRWFSPGKAPINFPFPEHKVARNCLVSAGVSREITRYRPVGKYDLIRAGNDLRNTALMRLISDVLNSIATQAFEAGAIYANNDGFIAPSHKTAARVIQIILDWGLTPTIKGEGQGGVKSSGAYQVGEVTSIPWKMRHADQPVYRVYPPNYIKWLQTRFAHFSAKLKD